MQLFSFVFALSMLVLISSNCKDNVSTTIVKNNYSVLADTSGFTIASRFPSPKRYKRIASEEGSFASYLRSLPLKPDGSLVKLHDGSQKRNQSAHITVVDLPIGNKNLHQCADAIMRLKAEYHYQKKDYAAIHFNFTNGHKVAYDEWRKGNRIKVSGNKTKWIESQEPSDSYESFWSYLETIFMYAGTLSLSKEMIAKDLNEMKIGDVFIKGGSPGHAVIVIDMIEDDTGKKKYMLAQSYMPAQELHILKNPKERGSPWYELDDSSKKIHSPEWTFSKEDLKGWQ